VCVCVGVYVYFCCVMLVNENGNVIIISSRVLKRTRYGTKRYLLDIEAEVFSFYKQQYVKP